MSPICVLSDTLTHQNKQTNEQQPATTTTPKKKKNSPWHLFTFKVYGIMIHATIVNLSAVAREDSRWERVGVRLTLQDWQDSLTTTTQWCKAMWSKVLEAAYLKNTTTHGVASEWHHGRINGAELEPTICAFQCAFHHVSTYCSCGEIYFRHRI